MIIITTRKRSLGQGNVFPVCLSTEGGGCYDVTFCYGQHPTPAPRNSTTLYLDSTTSGQHHPPGYHSPDSTIPLGQHHLWTAPPLWTAPLHPHWTVPPCGQHHCTSPRQHPLDSSTPWQYKPPRQPPPNSTTPVKKRAVSILLECFLVPKVSISVEDSAWNLISWHKKLCQRLSKNSEIVWHKQYSMSVKLHFRMKTTQQQRLLLNNTWLENNRW